MSLPGKLKLYGDPLSQPTRALLIFCRVNQIPHEFVRTEVMAGENREPEYTAMQPLKTVPLVVDGDFFVRDSLAAVGYLAAKFEVEDHWYPKEPALRARVDEYLHWQHLNTRLHASLYFQRMLGASPSARGGEREKRLRRNLDKVLDTIESVFLGGGSYSFIGGFSIPTVADLFACCELEQPRMSGWDLRDGRPVLSSYMLRVSHWCGRDYREVHEEVLQMVQQRAKL